MRKWARRRPNQAALFAVGGLFLLTLLVGGPLVALHQFKLKAIADDRAEVIRRNLYIAEMSLATNIIGQQNDLDQIREALDRWMPENQDGVDLRRWEWWFLNALGPEEVGVQEFEELVIDSTISPDGQQVALVLRDRVEIRSADLAEILATFPVSTRFPDWNPDSGLLAGTASHGVVDLMNPVAGEVRRSPMKGPGRVSFAEWSPDGRFYAMTSHDLTGVIWDFTKSQKIAEIDGFDRFPYTDWDRTGNRFYYAGAGTIRVWEERTGRSRDLCSEHSGGMVYGIEAAPDGRWLAVSLDNGRMRFISLPDGKVVAEEVGNDSEINKITWSPDSTQLATAGSDGAIQIWDAASRTRSGEIRLRGDIQAIEWTPSGQIFCDVHRSSLLCRSGSAGWRAANQFPKRRAFTAELGR